MKMEMDTEGLYTLETYDLSGTFKSATKEVIKDKFELANIISKYTDNVTIQNKIMEGFKIAELIKNSTFSVLG